MEHVAAIAHDYSLRMGNAVKDSRPEGPFLSARAEGLGTKIVNGLALKGPFMWLTLNDPFRVVRAFYMLPGPPARADSGSGSGLC